LFTSSLAWSSRQAAAASLGHISRLFRKGYRLRLRVASSNFARFDRNPQSGVASTLVKQSDFTVAEQQVFSSTAYPSRLILRVIRVATWRKR
jgi:predicted acyl esterase